MHNQPPRESHMRFMHETTAILQADPRGAALISARVLEYHAQLTGQESPAAGFIEAYDAFTLSADSMDATTAQLQGIEAKKEILETLAARTTTAGLWVDLERIRAITAYLEPLTNATDQLEKDTAPEGVPNPSPEEYGPLAQLVYQDNPEGDRAVNLHDMTRMILGGRIGGAIDFLSMAICGSANVDSDYANRVRQEVSQIVGRVYQPNAERLTIVRRDGKMSHIPPEMRQLGLKVIEMYRDWCGNYGTMYSLILRDGRRQVAESLEPVGPTPEEINGWAAEQVALTDSYQQLATPYRPGNRQIEKQGFRPLTTKLLKDIRDPRSTLGGTETGESSFAKRVVGTLVSLEQFGKADTDKVAARFEALVPLEDATITRLRQLDRQLKAVGHEPQEVPASLSDDLAWIYANWQTIALNAQANWPDSKGTDAIKNIEHSLKWYRAARRELEQDPRNKLYAAAKHLGRSALSPEVRVETKREVYRINRQAAAESLASLQGLAQNASLRNRADCILELSKSPDAELYFADRETNGRDRYFIVRTNDSEGRPWFVFETLDGERATYLIPIALLHDSHGTPLVNEEAELAAALDYNKSEVQLMGSMADFNPQLRHHEGWTTQSHLAKIMARMASFRL